MKPEISLRRGPDHGTSLDRKWRAVESEIPAVLALPKMSLCTRASSQQPRGRTLPTDAKRGRSRGSGGGGEAAPNHLGSALRATSALAGPGFLLRRKRWRPTAQPASSQICLTGTLEPSSTPALHAGPPRRGSTPGPRISRPRPVLTAVGTRDFPAARGEPGRLRPLSFRLRNSLDRSRESVAEEVVERLCSSRLLRRTTMVSRCGSRNPL